MSQTKQWKQRQNIQKRILVPAIQRKRIHKMKRTHTLRQFQKLLSNQHFLTIRKGKDATDAPAAGTRTYNLMSDPMRVSRVIDHFNIMDKTIRITKPTLSIPTLQVRLQETFAKLMADGLINTNPVRIQKASKGKIELWAHLPAESDH